MDSMEAPRYPSRPKTLRATSRSWARRTAAGRRAPPAPTGLFNSDSPPLKSMAPERMLPFSRLLVGNYRSAWYRTDVHRSGKDGAMIGFTLDEDQVAAQKWVREFAQKEIRPAAPHYDETEEIPWPVLKKAAQIGRFVPEMFGTAGDPRVGAFAVTEPGAGSDVSSLRTRAVRDGDDWVLNGQKVFITNGGIANVHIVVATVDPSLGHRGQASFVIPAGTPGLRQGKKERKLGIRASHTAEVLLDDCRVPADCLLGGQERLDAKLARARDKRPSRGSGALATFEATRPIVGAQAVGIARAAFEFARDYARERVQFGKPIAAQQGIAFKLADMATDIDAARLLVWRASWMGRNGHPFTRAEGSMSKLKAG